MTLRRTLFALYGIGIGLAYIAVLQIAWPLSATGDTHRRSMGILLAKSDHKNVVLMANCCRDNDIENVTLTLDNVPSAHLLSAAPPTHSHAQRSAGWVSRSLLSERSRIIILTMKLLVVEDYPPLQKSIVKGLRRAGFAVDATGNGDDGLWYALGNDYDTIVLDLMLPGMDGLTVLQKLRDAGREVHVLILTAKDTVMDRVTGLNCGADDYLVKPFAFEELLARVHALTRRRYNHKSPMIAIGELRIDTAAKRVLRGNEELSLTRREYELLEYLVRRRGHIVSRREIWEHLYDFADTTTSNVVDVYVGYLRKKIDSPGGPPLIRTVRGRGYTMEEES